MRKTRTRNKRLLVVWLTAAVFLSAAPAMADEAAPFRLELEWSAPITDAPPPPAPEGTSIVGLSTGVVLVAGATLPDGRVEFLGNLGRGLSQVLLPDLEHDGLDKHLLLLLDGDPPPAGSFLQSMIGNAPRGRPYLSALAAGSTGDLWAAGSANVYTDFADARHSDAYVARLEGSGKPKWERTYGAGGLRSIQRIAPMQSGGAVVAGGSERQGWIARIADDGRQMWDLRLGTDKGVAVTALADDRLVVAGVEATGSSQAHDYQDNIAVWIVDGSGKQLLKSRVRDAINRAEGNNFADITVAGKEAAVYVVSSWPGLFDAQPIEIAKFALDGSVIWKVSLPDSAIAGSGATAAWRNCRPSLAISQRGDPLIACALDGQMHLYQFDGVSGTYRESLMPLPECQAQRPAILFLSARDDGTFVLSGTTEASLGTSCSWVGILAETE